MFSRCSFSRRAVRSLLYLVAAGVLWTWAAWSQTSPFKPYEHRALYLYNFGKFTKWPESAFTNDEAPFIVAVLGEDPFKQDMAIIEGKPMKGRKVQVRRYRSLEQLGPCHLLFIAKSEQPRLTEILEQLKERPVLTVAEMDGFTESGGMVNLVLLEKKTLTFDINLVAAERASLKLDTRFLRLARHVKTE